MANDPREHGDGETVEAGPSSRWGLGLWVAACAAFGLPLAWVSTTIGQHYAPLLLFPFATGAVVGACLVGAMRVWPDAPTRDRHAGRGADGPRGRPRATLFQLSERVPANRRGGGNVPSGTADFRPGRPGQPAHQTGRTARFPPTRGHARTRTGDLVGQLHRSRLARLAELGGGRGAGAARGSRDRPPGFTTGTSIASPAGRGFTSVPSPCGRGLG